MFKKIRDIWKNCKNLPENLLDIMGGFSEGIYNVQSEVNEMHKDYFHDVKNIKKRLRDLESIASSTLNSLPQGELDSRLITIETAFYQFEHIEKDLIDIKAQIKKLTSKTNLSKKIETKPLIIKKTTRSKS